MRHVTGCAAAVAAMYLLAAGTSPAATPLNWEAKRVEDPFRNEIRCVVETPRQRINDGHQDTTIFLRVDDRSLLVLTESNLDLGHPDVGIRIDDGALIKPDKTYLDQNALFESSAATILAQFKAGLKVDVALRFWPTWPSMGVRTATFSLIGFTAALARLPGC